MNDDFLLKNGPLFCNSRYYLPTAQNITGLFLGRTPMPIATTGKRRSVALATFRPLRSRGVIRYTIDGTEVTGSSAAYSGVAIVTPVGAAVVRAKAYEAGLSPSRELVLHIIAMGAE